MTAGEIISDIMIRAIAPGAGLLAVAEQNDVISGGGGWVGAGLLGMVLGWLLLKHLPEKDKQIADLMTTYDKKFEDSRTAFITAFKAQTDAHAANIDKINAGHKETIKDIIEHCADEARRLRDDCKEMRGHQ